MLNHFLLGIQLLNIVDQVNGQIVSDFRIANRDVTPAIGRGYSISSGNMASLCLEVDTDTDITEPSFDYTYFFQYLTEETVSSIANTQSYSNGQAFLHVQNAVAENARVESKMEVKTHSVWAMMEVEKYYISADESKINMAEDAINLLDRSLYVQFFQACGPSFIRSMRRSCEFSTLFDLKTEEATDTATLDYIIQSAGSSISDSTVIAESTSSEDLTISMTAYGIDISSSNAFMARSFDAYGDVLDAAFKSCMDPNVGLVKSIEVVPWVNNVQFQNIAKLDRSLETGTAEQSRMLSPFLRRFNLITNAEHVGRLAEVLRHRMTTFGMVMKCLAAANAFPHLDNNRELLDKYHTCPLNRSTPCPAYTGQMTLFDLKEALRGIDSSGKYLIERMADNINDYIEHYMTPCLTDMTSEAFGVVGGNMQSQHWIRMDGCLEVSCVFVGVKWDPSTNKCVADAPEDNLDYTVDRFCAPKFSTGRP